MNTQPHTYVHALMASSHNTANANTTQTTSRLGDTSQTIPVYPQFVESNTNSFYLHNNDQPGMVLISKKSFGYESYASWKRSMQIALYAKNKLVIVNGDFV